ncbi:MAG TPA: PQQ-binding-like beta-propeller repeat protein [Pirellulaceae bacterium]|jgi:outer membrane protein assembly factor BamB
MPIRAAAVSPFDLMSRVVAIVLILAYSAASIAYGQVAAQNNGLAAIEPDPSDALFPGCAALKTDAEYERILKRADEYVADGRTDLAVVLWQKVLDEAGDTLAADGIVQPLSPSSSPLVIYRPIRQRVEKQLLRLPASALAAYRTSADADARALLAAAQSEHDEKALTNIVRRYFLSNSGGHAALNLAGLALDRHDFLTAMQLLQRLLEHPDFSLAKPPVLARLAVAAAHLNDKPLAQQAQQQLAASDGSAANEKLAELIATEMTAALERNKSSKQPAAWPMLFGNSARTGLMPSVPPSILEGPLTESWIHELAIPSTDNAALPPLHRRGDENSTAMLDAATKAARSDLVRQWRLGGWRPTGRLLFDGGRVLMKSSDRLECFNANAASNQPLWQSAWRNVYELDPLSRQFTRLAGAGPQPVVQPQARLNSRQAIWAFGDRVHQSMAVAERVVYSLEGRRATAAQQQPEQRRLFADSASRRTRTNWLTAYEASGGKAIWTRPAAEDEKAAEAEVGFLAAPIECSRMLLAPVTEGGAVWLLALDKLTGQTIRKTFLCDEPQGGVSPWAEIVMAAEGSELYLSCGCGVVFAVSAIDGNVRWAVRYGRALLKRDASRDAAAGPSDSNSAAAAQGWDDDVVIVHNTTLLIMASDSDRLLALDRRTGRRLWESPRVSPLGAAASYCLGATEDALFVAGKNVVRKYDIATGRLVAEQPVSDSFARGCLTSTAVLIPADDEILEFDLNLAATRQSKLALTSPEPVGNLFSDGERLWVVGAARIYTLATVRNRLDQLEQRIAASDIEARFERAQLYRIQNEFKKVSGELTAAFAALAERKSPREAAQRVFLELAELRLAQDQPLITLKIIAGLPLASSTIALDAETQQLKRDLVASALASIRQHPPAGSAVSLSDNSALFDEDYLMTAAAAAMDRAATNADAALLSQSVESGTTAARLMSIGALTRIAPEKAARPLADLLRDRDDRVRLASARALASSGERRGVLQTLVELLQSPHLTVRSRAHHTLQALTGQSLPFPADGAADDRDASARAWREWVQTHSATANLKLPLEQRATPLGRLLVASSNLLIELGAQHKERWRFSLPGAAWGCEGLPNGHRLVAINSHSMVIEYDEAGKEVWRKDRLPAPPTTVQRLNSGATLVACGNAHQIVEIARDGATTTVNVPGCPISAQRLDSGNTLVALQDLQRVVEVNSIGRTVWEIETTSEPAHACRLENGNTLVTLAQARKVVEYDVTGKNILWMSAIPLINPAAAQRLSNGNTLVADHTGVIEIDASGNQAVWRHRQPQAIGFSSF